MAVTGLQNWTEAMPDASQYVGVTRLAVAKEHAQHREKRRADVVSLAVRADGVSGEQ